MMKTIFRLAFLIAALTGAASQAMAGTAVYVPLGEAGEILVLDAADDVTIGRISGLPAVHGLAGTPGGEYLVAGSYVERPVGGAALPPKPRGMSQSEHEAHHAKRPANPAPAADAVSFLSVIRIADGAITRRIEVPGAVHHTAVVPGGRFAVATHPNRDSVSVVDLSAGRILAEVRTGPLPNYAVVSPDGKRVYVSNAGNDTVSEIDTEHWTVRGSVGVGKGPEHMVLSPDGAALYVANAEAGNISVISLPEGSVTDTLRIGGALHGVDLSDDGKTLFISGREWNKLVAVDLATKKTRSKPLAPSPYHVTAIRGTGKLYVSSAEEAKLWVVDQESLAVAREILIPGKGHQMVVVNG
ncbi:MAG: YncE family protein [Rhodospirillales bacterium]